MNGNMMGGLGAFGQSLSQGSPGSQYPRGQAAYQPVQMTPQVVPGASEKSGLGGASPELVNIQRLMAEIAKAYGGFGQ